MHWRHFLPRLNYINKIQWLEARPFSLQVWASDKHRRGCCAITGRVLGEAPGGEKKTTTQPYRYLCILIRWKTNSFSVDFLCDGMFGVACSVHACGKWKVNSKAVGRYLPSFLSPPATLTVQSQDNEGETNSVLRQSNSPPLYCRCVSLRWAGGKWHFV